MLVVDSIQNEIQKQLPQNRIVTNTLTNSHTIQEIIEVATLNIWLPPLYPPSHPLVATTPQPHQSSTYSNPVPHTMPTSWPLLSSPWLHGLLDILNAPHSKPTYSNSSCNQHTTLNCPNPESPSPPIRLSTPVLKYHPMQSIPLNPLMLGHATPQCVRLLFAHLSSSLDSMISRSTTDEWKQQQQ
jgi:hypothetical protein